MTARAVRASEMEVFQRLKRDLHLRPSTFEGEVEATVAAVVRRLSGFMCPCPKFALARAAVRSLTLYPETWADVADQVEISIEDLMISGDLIEFSKVTAVGAEDHPTWLFCAPPSFVRRADGRIYVFGVAPDDAVFLPGEVLAQVHHLGATRYIDAPDAAPLVDVLHGLGLRQISDAAWLIPHHAEAPDKFIGRMTKRLQQDGVKGELPEISILRHATATALTYRQRWTSPKDETGTFIGRHPHPYGAPLWYLCELQEGQVQRSLLLPLPEQAARACDIAWQIQLAIDARQGFPAAMRTRIDPDGEGAYLDVHFPLPMAARRRLTLLGSRNGKSGPSGFSFWLPASQLRQEESFLKDHFWYAPQQNSEDIQ